MLKYFIWGVLVSSVVALTKDDKCPNANEKPGILEKSCEDEKFEVYKELTCVCEWFYYRNADGKCVSKEECEGKVTTTTTTTTAAPTTPCPTSPTQKPGYCPEGYELTYVYCKRTYGGYGYHDPYYGKKCAVCKPKKTYGK